MPKDIIFQNEPKTSERSKRKTTYFYSDSPVTDGKGRVYQKFSMRSFLQEYVLRQLNRNDILQYGDVYYSPQEHKFIMTQCLGEKPTQHYTYFRPTRKLTKPQPKEISMLDEEDVLAELYAG